MKTRSLHLPAAFALACIVLLAACGDSATTDAAVETTTSTITGVDAEDDRSPEQMAIDDLDVTMYQLGVRDLAPVSDCVLERLESEGLSLIDNEAAELAALVGCEPAVSSTLFGDRSEAFGAEPWACTTDELGQWIGAIPLAEAQSFFEAPTPPAELITLVSETCDVPEADFLAIFS